MNLIYNFKKGDKIKYKDYDLDSIGQEGDIFTVVDVINRNGRSKIKAVDKYEITYLFKENEMEIVIGDEWWSFS